VSDANASDQFLVHASATDHPCQHVPLFPYDPEGKIAEPRTGRRMHLDVMPTGGTRDEEVVRLSTRIIASPRRRLVTMADPEGNPCCVERSQEHHGPTGVVLPI
jgi:hypothetical protein